MAQPESAKLKTILVVDDEVSICLILMEMLQEKGFEVVIAHDGDQALEMFRNQDLDMVLTDINMPRLDGLAVLRAIKESKPSTPVVMMSGRADMQDVIEAMDRGAQNFLLKPIRVDELYRVIERLELALAANPLGGDMLSLATVQKVCFESPSRPDYVRGLLSQLEQCAAMMDYCGKRLPHGLKLAIYEAVTNSMEHGNKWDANKNIWIDATISSENLSIKISDEGEGFDYYDYDQPRQDIMDERGRGLFIIRSFVDECSFANDGRTIILSKKKEIIPKD